MHVHYVVIITCILKNGPSVNGILDQHYLMQIKHSLALGNGLLARKHGLTVYECFEECFYRKRCKSFEFRKHFNVCLLNSYDSASELKLLDSPGTVYSEKVLWDMSQLPPKCNQCADNARCMPESSNIDCVKKECYKPTLNPHQHLLGNLFDIGNKYKVISSPAGNETLFTCSAYQDIGTVLGGDCIYSCVVQNSACQDGKCVCPTDYSDVNGSCIPDIGTVLGGDCIYTCIQKNSACLEGHCVCTSDYSDFGGSCVSNTGTSLGDGCIISCAIKNSVCTARKCVCASDFIESDGYCVATLSNCAIDVAYRKTLTMSSDYMYDTGIGKVSTWPYAVNGVNSGDWYQASCSSTEHESNPWLLLDLETNFIIWEMQIINRNSKPERLRNLHIEFGPDRQLLSEIHFHPGIVPAVLRITFSMTHTGQYIRMWIDAVDFLTICGIIVSGCRAERVPYKDCNDVKDQGFTTSGEYSIQPRDSTESFSVYCDMTTDGGGWLAFQRREDGSVNFYKGWHDYETGFGDVTGEHWLGNKHLHEVVSQGHYELRVDLEDFEGNRRYANYRDFSIADSSLNYTLSVSDYSGDAGNSFEYQSGAPFSTFDHDSTSQCPSTFHGGWWFKQCHFSHLNGVYIRGAHAGDPSGGVYWYHWKGFHYSLKKTEMKIRKV